MAEPDRPAGGDQPDVVVQAVLLVAVVDVDVRLVTVVHRLDRPAVAPAGGGRTGEDGAVLGLHEQGRGEVRSARERVRLLGLVELAEGRLQTGVDGGGDAGTGLAHVVGLQKVRVDGLFGLTFQAQIASTSIVQS